LNGTVYDIHRHMAGGRGFAIKRCPRCGGTLVRPHRAGAPDELSGNSLKCFCCGRFFLLVMEGSRFVWKQYPDRDEPYALVYENIGRSEDDRN